MIRDRGGHVFVVRGDVTALACDAWLVPSDDACNVEPIWHRALEVEARPLETLGRGPVTAVSWPHRQRRPWLVDVVDDARRIDNAALALESAAREVDEPANGREKPLIALPLIGTGGGGARSFAGQVVSDLLPVLHARARALDVDVALVLDNPAAYAAAQKARSALDEPFAPLGRDLLARADALAERARSGRLVLFLGAGTGRAAGLPLWREMLRNLACEAGLDDDAVRALERLPPLDQAQYLAGIFQERSALLVDAVVRQVAARSHSITHALLASLPVEEVVTTNYDDLFERAWRARGVVHSVLPHGPRADAGRFVLKLHGCVTCPDQIVLTREDYLRYLDDRAALVGMVQALLLTKHMLFVGTSLEDESFHRIVHEVRKAVRLGDPAPSTFGTVLDLSRRRFVQELWRDLDWIDLTPESDRDDVMPAAARRLEIFLDRLAASATSSSEYLLQAGYHGADEAEERLRARLLDLLSDTSLREADAWREVEALAARLGHPRGE